MGRTEKENKNEKDQPWGWLIGHKVSIIDWDEEEKKIRSIGVIREDVVHPHSRKPIIRWLSFYVEPRAIEGHILVS